MEMFHTQGKKTQGKHTNTTNFWHVRSHDYVITAVSKNIVCVAFLLLSPSLRVPDSQQQQHNIICLNALLFLTCFLVRYCRVIKE